MLRIGLLMCRPSVDVQRSQGVGPVILQFPIAGSERSRKLPFAVRPQSLWRFIECLTHTASLLPKTWSLICLVGPSIAICTSNANHQRGVSRDLCSFLVPKSEGNKSCKPTVPSSFSVLRQSIEDCNVASRTKLALTGPGVTLLQGKHILPFCHKCLWESI